MFNISKEIDTRFMNPPQPMLRALRAMDNMQTGEVLKLTTTECNALWRLELLCQYTGMVMMQYMDWDGEFTFFIRKCQ